MTGFVLIADRVMSAVPTIYDMLHPWKWTLIAQSRGALTGMRDVCLLSPGGHRRQVGSALSQLAWSFYGMDYLHRSIKIP